MTLALALSENLSLSLPAGLRLLRSVDDIERAWEWEAVGHVDGARALIRDLQDRMNLEVAERVTSKAITRNNVANAERQRALSLIPNDEAPLTENELSALRMADLRLHESEVARRARRYKVARAKLIDARRLVNSVEERQRGRSEARWTERVLAEITALEFALGGSAERRVIGAGKPLVILSRDGLLTLYEANRLDSTALAAGLQYRRLYEQTDPEHALKPKSIDPADEPATRGGEGWAEKRAELWNTRARVDKRVLALVRQKGLSDLHHVVGKGRCVHALYSGGHSRELATERVVRALAEVTAALGFG